MAEYFAGLPSHLRSDEESDKSTTATSWAHVCVDLTFIFLDITPISLETDCHWIKFVRVRSVSAPCVAIDKTCGRCQLNCLLDIIIREVDLVWLSKLAPGPISDNTSGPIEVDQVSRNALTFLGDIVVNCGHKKLPPADHIGLIICITFQAIIRS